MPFPPSGREELSTLGWDACDIIIVTGDAYVDHPAFGSAVIARVLEDAGFRVGVISQPDWRSTADFTALGRPRLAFAVTAGNVDSMVANYSPSFQRRREDDYSPGGRPGLRPPRASTVYANRLREAFPGVPLVLGGVEASLRRLAHYDYWDDRVRPSLLADTRADILVYGMGELAAVEIARRLDAGAPLDGIPGTCVIRREMPAGDACVLPSYEAARDDAGRFNEAFRAWYLESARPVVQPHANRFVVQEPAGPPLSGADLDRVYDLPYTRLPHPSCPEPVPALATVAFSITSHRGCLGSCAFCSLRAHQGRIIGWRTEASVVREAAAIALLPDFRGHITDVGGPTVNMYGATCARMKRGAVCADRDCLWPEPCPNLRLALDRQLALLAAVAQVPGVRKVTVGSGLRFDLLDGAAGLGYLEQLCRSHVSGQLRVAPEHVCAEVLARMRKYAPGDWQKFRERFRRVNEKLGLKQYLIPYFISGHPGATADSAVELAEHLVRDEKIRIRQVQQFTPLPMTLSAAVWHTGRDPLTGDKVEVARSPEEQRLQRCLLQLHVPANRAFAERELERMGCRDLLRRVQLLAGVQGAEEERPVRKKRDAPGGPAAGKQRLRRGPDERFLSDSGTDSRRAAPGDWVRDSDRRPARAAAGGPGRRASRPGTASGRRDGDARGFKRRRDYPGPRPGADRRPARAAAGGPDGRRGPAGHARGEEWDTRPRRPGSVWPGRKPGAGRRDAQKNARPHRTKRPRRD
ncbi:MAG: YgiQ family radical SAM protein [bacterium]